MRFAGKSVLVTGAASGIGRAAALLFAAEGAKVMATDLSEDVAAIAEGLDMIGTLVGDAGNETDVKRMIDAAVTHGGGLDILVANAGISGGAQGLFDTDAAEFAELLRINLIGPYLAVKHGAPHMIGRGEGAIVVTASVSGLRAGSGALPYSASKAAAINMVQSAAQQLTGTGVRVNAVCPGLIETGMTRGIFDHARAVGKEDRIGILTPLQRGGEPGEIAAAIAFLASPDASYITGHALVVDGGLSSSHPFLKPPRRTGVAPI